MTLQLALETALNFSEATRVLKSMRNMLVSDRAGKGEVAMWQSLGLSRRSVREAAEAEATQERAQEEEGAALEVASNFTVTLTSSGTTCRLPSKER
jgi:hypothetical protein